MKAIELLILSPRFSLERLAFAFPFKDPRQLDGISGALRKACLPEWQ